MHKIFNVSILRPRGKFAKHWDGDDLNFGDEVTIQIEFMDLGSQIPFIRGALKL